MEFLPDGSISSPQEYIKYYSEITESFQILTMKGGSDAFNELKEKQEKETKLFDEMYLPCALQGILLYEQEKDWYHSPDMKLANKNKLLYRVTKSEFLNTELELETSDGESQVGKIVKLKKFMSFAIGENDKQFLTEEEYPNPQLFGTYDTGLVVTISEKTKAKSISFTNKNKNGQREALFPIGTSLEVTKLKKNTGILNMKKNVRKQNLQPLLRPLQLQPLHPHLFQHILQIKRKISKTSVSKRKIVKFQAPKLKLLR